MIGEAIHDDTLTALVSQRALDPVGAPGQPDGAADPGALPARTAAHLEECQRGGQVRRRDRAVQLHRRAVARRPKSPGPWPPGPPLRSG